MASVTFISLLITACCALGNPVGNLLTPKKEISDYIYGGNEAKPGQFPFVISLRVNRSIDNILYHKCGGSIISNRFIVTAAHCVVNKLPEDHKVLVGAHLKYHDRNAQLLTIKQFIVHEVYDADVVGLADIGLIELVEPIRFTASIAPIKINKNVINKTVDAVICGWGESDDAISNLKFAKLLTLTNDDCRRMHNDSDAPIYNYGTLCAYSGKEGVGVCSGDSGGPLVHNDELIGVASWAVLCAQGVPDGFTRVSQYYSWIKKHVPVV